MLVVSNTIFSPALSHHIIFIRMPNFPFNSLVKGTNSTIVRRSFVFRKNLGEMSLQSSNISNQSLDPPILWTFGELRMSKKPFVRIFRSLHLVLGHFFSCAFQIVQLIQGYIEPPSFRSPTLGVNLGMTISIWPSCLCYSFITHVTSCDFSSPTKLSTSTVEKIFLPVSSHDFCHSSTEDHPCLSLEVKIRLLCVSLVAKVAPLLNSHVTGNSLYFAYLQYLTGYSLCCSHIVDLFNPKMFLPRFCG